jgi:hypothetical protein
MEQPEQPASVRSPPPDMHAAAAARSAANVVPRLAPVGEPIGIITLVRRGGVEGAAN